ncbi:probable glycosyltransferase At5g03795 [Mangifera indica]|uniref:probable glycosyltransferase At5g03795 n=1 Tax=Mangifera indica TaxID=29780 RepID=UPI001CFB60EB|nr:probable glycosyltransferase At5g03795 [Mangifera indica]
MMSQEPKSSPSCFWSSSSFLVLLAVILPLTVISVLVFILTPAHYFSWSPTSSPFTWRHGFPGSYSFASSSLVDSATPSNVFITNETIQLGEDQNTLKHNQSVHHVGRRYTNLMKIEASLARARSSIRKAALMGNLTSTLQDPDFVPKGPIYRNANAFYRSYLEMEKLFRIYVYEEGEPPMVHYGPCKNIYTTEGRFIYEIEKDNIFKTKDPDKATVYFLPFTIVMMVEYLFVPGAHDINGIRRSVADYINVISTKHPFWNRSLGADHLMLSCHDWGPIASASVPELYNKSIRVLCNANTSEGFNPSKDATLPEINLQTGEITGLIGGPSPSRRSLLAFFSGRLHGHIRHLLLEQWKNKDHDVQVYDKLPEGVSYYSMLRKSKFCLCPSGFEVASPRVVESIYAECVPVLISESYVPPFSDVLNWKSFSVQIAVKDIPNIKNILMGISQSQYLRMQRRVKQVQRHFVINDTPKRFDVFHMTLHSIWLRRLNIQIKDFHQS